MLSTKTLINKESNIEKEELGTCLNSSLHYFNPNHEAAILHGGAHFSPKKNVQTMQKDLAALPLWYANDGDYVLVEDETATDYFSALPKQFQPKAIAISSQQLATSSHKTLAINPQTNLTACPWGLSPQSITHFQQLKLCQTSRSPFLASLSIPEWNPILKQLASRETAALCLDTVKGLLAESSPELCNIQTPFFCSSMEEVDTYMEKVTSLPYIFKMPFSSSGRGLLWIRKLPMDKNERAWVDRAIKGQGLVSIEPALDGVADYAWEFFSDGNGRVHYVGLSTFATDKRGCYTGNILQNPQEAEKNIASLFGKTYELFKKSILISLEKHYAPFYKGYLGVDIMSYQRENKRVHLHPCIEVNVRNTMGLLALRLSERLLSHTTMKGEFKLLFFKKQGESLQEHITLQKKYPLRMNNEGDTLGYFSLCPVRKETHFLAYVILFSSTKEYSSSKTYDS